MTHDKTAFDAGATRVERGETVFERDRTVYEGSTAVTEKEATVAASAPSDGVAFEKGSTILDTYRVEGDPIHGGMGSVWRVRHTGWNTDLAMKRPKPELFQSEEEKEMFIGECEAWINLGLHPNIVSCYYVREIEGTPTIFSEWMDGGSLKDAIERGTLYAGTEAEQKERLLDVAVQFARGLRYSHENGLIHQDVKPDNLLLTKEGDVKVADFGIAQARAALTVLDGDLTMQENADGTMISASGAYTPAYCSMEQMDGKVLTRRTDIYSWAVSVMEMYTGSRPWMNGVVAGLSCRGYFEDARVSMPKTLKELLAKCMETEPDDRPHDFAEVESALKEIYKVETGASYPRPEPKAAVDTADSLNNRALSYLDLGKPEEAEALWGKALDSDPNHVPSMCNLQQQLWSSGRTTDIEAISRLEVLETETQDETVRHCIRRFYMHTNDYEGLSRKDRQWGVTYETAANHPFDARNPGTNAVMSAAFTHNGYILAGGKGSLSLLRIDGEKLEVCRELCTRDKRLSISSWNVGRIIKTFEDDVFDCYCWSEYRQPIKARLKIKDDECLLYEVVETEYPDVTQAVSTFYNVKQNDKGMRLAFYSAGSARCLRTYPGYYCADISPDGRYALIVERAFDGFLRVVELPQDAPLKQFILSVISGTGESLENERKAQRIIRELYAAVSAKDYAFAVKLLSTLRSIPGFETTAEADDAETVLAGVCKAKRIAFAMLCPHKRVIPAPEFQPETVGREIKRLEDKLKKETLAKIYDLDGDLWFSQPHKKVHITVEKASIEAGIAVCYANYTKTGRYGYDRALCREIYRINDLKLWSRSVVKDKCTDRGYLIGHDGSVIVEISGNDNDIRGVHFYDGEKWNELYEFYGECRAMALSADNGYWSAIIDNQDNAESAVVIVNTADPENLFRISLHDKQTGSELRFSQDGLMLEGSGYCIRLGYDYDPAQIKTSQVSAPIAKEAPRKFGFFGKRK